MGIQINGNTDNISATDGGLTVSDLELNQTGVSTFHSHLHVADQIIHLDDANSKIRFPAADTITAETAGSERFRITSGGAVGIGTDNPASKLTIAEDSASTNAELAINYIGSGTRTAAIRFQRGGTNFGYIAGGNFMLTGGAADDLAIAPVSGKNLLFGIGSSEKLRIDSSGRLLVGGTGNTESDIRLYLHNSGAAGSQLQFTGNASGTGNSDGFRVGYNGSGGQLWLFENQFVRIATNNAERLRIDSSGHVGIGTDNPAVSLQGNWNKILEVSAGIHTGSMIRFTESGVGGGVNKGMLVGEHDNNAYLINYQNGFLQFRTNGADRGRFDASGRLLIGDSSVEGWSPDADDFTISNTGANCGMTIRSNASGYSSIFFSDATSGTGEYDGFLQYGHSAQRLSIGAGSATKMSILNNGHVTTQGNNNGNPVGMELRNNNTAAYSHAELSLTSQNTTTSKIWCDVPNAKMRLQYNGGSTVDIDQSGNIHVPSGSGISFSASSNFGTMSSEVLDDYEEGYWTPTIGGHLSNGSTSYGNQKGAYCRVGALVYLSWYISWSSTTATGQVRILGQPFTAATTHGTNYNITTGSMMFDSINVPYASGQTVPYLQNAATFIVYYSSYSTGGWSIMTHGTETQNGGSLICSISYRAA